MAASPRPWTVPVARVLAYCWRGPADLPGPLELEWRVVTARWLAILCIYPGLAVSPLTQSQRSLVTLILLLGMLYNLGITWLIFARPAFIASGYPTTLGDLALNTAMLLGLGGGFDSAYAYIFFVLVVSVAMRFGHRLALGITALVILINALQNFTTGVGFDAGLVFRGLFLGLTGFLASYLREQSQRTNQQLQRSNRALQETYAELHKAHQQLLTLDAAKTNFVANVSHELRTPLTSIRAYSELLLTYDESPAVQREFLGIINAESERLTRLVSNVLDIMKIEAGRLDWRVATVDVAELLRYSVKIYAPLAEQQGVALHLALPPVLPAVRGDRDRLLQVLSNLIANGLKFTVQGAITLSAAQVGDELRIAVRDTGVGIAPEEQAHIFEKFYQGGRLLTDKPVGTGLGLTICKEIVEQHQGRIWVESQPGYGSTFTIALSLAAESGAGEPPLPVESAPRHAVDHATPEPVCRGLAAVSEPSYPA